MRADRPRLSPAFKSSASHAGLVLLTYAALFTIFFSPVLFSNSLLAPGGGRLGDGLLYHLTFFQSSKVLWDPMLFCGFPMMADPQVMSWYPPSTLLSLVPDGWNIFVLSAYVMASCFTYGYVYALTRSKLASVVSGTVYGMSGFMMAHLGHTAMVHTAVWLPLIIWSLEMQRKKFSRAWFAITCAAIACCVFAGHLQIVLYSLVLAAGYVIAMGWNAPAGRTRYYLAAAVAFALGLGLSAVQLLPAAELAGLSTRSEYGFSDFVSYSLPFKQIVSFIFPAVFGGLQRYGDTPYFGAWNPTEMAGYVGLLPLMLAAVGFTVARRKLVSIFWLCVVLIALLLALGDQTPLAHLIYRLPLLGKFRAPARHLLELTFAVSVLAGVGVNAVLSRAVTRALTWKIVGGTAVVVLAGLAFLFMRRGEYALAQGGTARLNALPWNNPAVAIPLIIFLLASLVFVWWQGSAESIIRKSLLLVLLVLDLSSFGWVLSWHQDSQPKTILQPPAVAVDHTNELAAKRERILALRGTEAAADEAPPNVSRLWGLASAAGYSPLSPAHVNELMSMRPDGSVDPVWKQSTNQALNLAGVRYVTMPKIMPAKEANGVLWNSDDMDFWVGASACVESASKSIRFDFGNPVDATTVGVVSRLACSVGTPDGAETLRVSATDGAGNRETQTVVAGRDTAEWAYDCPTVRPSMRHQRPTIFSNFPAKMNTDACEGHFYVTTLSFRKLRNLQYLEFSWAGQTEAISINKLSLVNPNTRSSVPLDPIAARGDRWQLMEESGNARIYRNLRVLPRAWLTSETVTLEPEKILNAIRTSRLPDGRPYDPTRMALLEDSRVNLPSGPRDLSERASVTKLTDTTMEVETYSEKPSFLVTSDLFYPGWRATIDGLPAQIFVANYALRGVQLSAGRHQVRFEFAPRRFYFGAGITGLSLAVLLGILFVNRWWRMPSIAQGKLVDNQKSAE